MTEVDKVGFEVWLRWRHERGDDVGGLGLELMRTGSVDYDRPDVRAAFAEFDRFMSVEGVREWAALPDPERDRARRVFNAVGLGQMVWETDRRRAEQTGTSVPEKAAQLQMF